MLILLHFTDPTSEGRSVVMNFGNDKHSFNCWLSAIRMGIFGRKKLKDSFEGLSTAAAISPVSSKSKEGGGLGDFRLFSKFGKLRLMAGGGTKKSEAIDMPRATSDPASLTNQPMASSFVSMPGESELHLDLDLLLTFGTKKPNLKNFYLVLIY